MGQLSGLNKCEPDNIAATVANLGDVFEPLLAIETNVSSPRSFSPKLLRLGHYPERRRSK
jgi:hypothetical protein